MEIGNGCFYQVIFSFDFVINKMFCVQIVNEKEQNGNNCFQYRMGLKIVVFKKLFLLKEQVYKIQIQIVLF